MFKNLFKKKTFEEVLISESYKKALKIQERADKEEKTKHQPKINKVVEMEDFKQVKDGAYSLLTNLVGEQFDNRQKHIKLLTIGDKLTVKVGTYKGEPSMEIKHNDLSIGWIPADLAKELEPLNKYFIHFKVTSIVTRNNFLNVRGQLVYSPEAKQIIDIL